MLKLPKVNKGVHHSLSRLEKVKNVVAGVAVAMGITLAGVSGGEAQAATAQVQQPVPVTSGALLLTPSGHAPTVIAGHESHSSHASHRSHYSHYSSRY